MAMLGFFINRIGRRRAFGHRAGGSIGVALLRRADRTHGHRDRRTGRLWIVSGDFCVYSDAVLLGNCGAKKQDR